MKHKQKTILFCVLFLLSLILTIWNNTHDEKDTIIVSQASQETRTEDFSDKPIHDIVKHFSRQNNVDERVMLAMMECESGGRKVKGDGGRAYNEFQFHKPTWDRMSKKMGEELDINSGYDQAKLATWAVANGYGREWTSYVAIKNGGKYSFYSSLMKKHYTVTCNIKDYHV